MISNVRKWFGLFIGIIFYYIVHEGSHVIVSLCLGVFENIRLLGVGMQVVISEGLSDVEKAIFCVSGCISTLIVGYLLVLFSKKIVNIKNKFVKAICYYSTIIFLFLDPLYLSILYRFFGGGDMNGIVLLGVNEIFVEILFVLIFIVNLFIFVNRVYPLYKESFSNGVKFVI